MSSFLTTKTLTPSYNGSVMFFNLSSLELTSKQNSSKIGADQIPNEVCNSFFLKQLLI